MEEFVPCGECDNGYIYEETGSGEQVRKCECLREWQRRRHLEIAFTRSGLSELDLKFDIENYIGNDEPNNIPKLKLYAFEFEKFANTSLYLWSEHNSTQKTTVAKWVLARLAENGYRVAFVLFNDLVRLLQEYGFDESREEEYQRIASADCLVIDDAFDPNKSTIYKSGYQYAFIDTFLRDRLEVRRKATIFTANVAVNDISESYTASIQAMVKRNVQTMKFSDIVKESQHFKPYQGESVFPELNEMKERLAQIEGEESE